MPKTIVVIFFCLFLVCGCSKGGGGKKSAPAPDTIAPTGSVKINNGAAYTNSISVTLNLTAQDNPGGGGLSQMRFSNDNVNWSAAEAYAATKTWNLTLGDGAKVVFVQYSDKAGNWSVPCSNIIFLETKNKPPEIVSMQPQDNSSFLSGVEIPIKINAVDPEGSILQYQFAVGGTVKQAWSSADSYVWQTSDSDVGTVDISGAVKDANGLTVSKNVSCLIINPGVEKILQKVADNYAKIYDFKADITISSTLDGQPFGQTEYCRYYFKAPDKEKTDTYSGPARNVKTDAIIIDGSTMHLINSANKTVQSIDLLADAGIGAVEFKQMDLYYNQALLLNENNVVRNDQSADLNNMIVGLDIVPKEPNKIYDKIHCLIDYQKGIIIDYFILKKDDSGELKLVQEISVIDSIEMPNGAWLPAKMTKTPNLTAVKFITTLTYDGIQMNTGLSDPDFDPSKQ